MKKYENPQLELLNVTKDIVTVSDPLDDDVINAGDNFVNDIFVKS